MILPFQLPSTYSDVYRWLLTTDCDITLSTSHCIQWRLPVIVNRWLWYHPVIYTLHTLRSLRRWPHDLGLNISSLLCDLVLTITSLLYRLKQRQLSQNKLRLTGRANRISLHPNPQNDNNNNVNYNTKPPTAGVCFKSYLDFVFIIWSETIFSWNFDLSGKDS